MSPTSLTAEFTSGIGTAINFHGDQPDAEYLKPGSLWGGMIRLTQRAGEPLEQQLSDLAHEAFGSGPAGVLLPLVRVDDGYVLRVYSMVPPDCWTPDGRELTRLRPVPNGTPIRVSGVLKTYNIDRHRSITAYLTAYCVQEPARPKVSPFLVEA